MKRYALESLKKWKNSPSRKPLLLYGARQVGKTWLVRDFAKSEYDDFIELNFFTDQSLKSIFGDNITPINIIQQLELRFDRKIDPARTLLFFDEIQESQRAMDSLKTFNDMAPEYNIVAAGSFLGVMVGRRPVGQTDQMTLYPMSFCEFVEAVGNPMLANSIKTGEVANMPSLGSMLESLLKQYFYVGGMPAAVQEYVNTKDWKLVRKIQKELINTYKGDFSKHIPDARTEPKIRMLWDSISLHLIKETNKFVYSNVKVGGRAAEFENAMQWLKDTGLVYKINKVETPKIPLKMHYKEDAFKLFMLDIGLLAAQAAIKPADILSADVDIIDDMNGALAEQFVLQEFVAAGISPIFYWGRDKGKAELDFLIQGDGEIIPVEVKSAKRTKSQSLRVYREEYEPKHAVRTSLKNYGVVDGLISIPLYLISEILPIIKNAE